VSFGILHPLGPELQYRGQLIGVASDARARTAMAVARGDVYGFAQVFAGWHVAGVPPDHEEGWTDEGQAWGEKKNVRTH